MQRGRHQSSCQGPSELQTDEIQCPTVGYASQVMPRFEIRLLVAIPFAAIAVAEATAGAAPLALASCAQTGQVSADADAGASPDLSGATVTERIISYRLSGNPDRSARRIRVGGEDS